MISKIFNKTKAFFKATPVENRTLTIGPNIAIVNCCKLISADEITKAVEAIQIQIDRDLVPIWNLPANLYVYQQSDVLPKNSWVMYIMDTSDQAGALGYHELTEEGNPIGYVFAADDIKYGLSWTVTLSHEIIEMLGDPFINQVVFVQKTNTTGTLYSWELNDAVEDDSLGYKINDVLVSDFVTPQWFQEFKTPNSTQFSFMNNVHAPFELANGGYIGAFEVGPPDSQGWTQVTPASGIGKRLAIKGPFSRNARRMK
jgi:hypothetical protein